MRKNTIIFLAIYIAIITATLVLPSIKNQNIYAADCVTASSTSDPMGTATATSREDTTQGKCFAQSSAGSLSTSVFSVNDNSVANTN